MQPGATVELRLRLRAPRAPSPTHQTRSGSAFDKVMAERAGRGRRVLRRADPKGASADEAMVMRQAFSGMLWSKQLYYYDVARWLEGDPTQPPPPTSRL